MTYIVTINDKSYEVEVKKNEALIRSTNKTAEVPVRAQSMASEAVQPKAVQAEPAPVQISGGDTITAPMPGTIIGVKKNKGEQVKKGDIIFILEAMKMENEILSPTDGVLIDITVAKGSTVNTEDVLAVIG